MKIFAGFQVVALASVLALAGCNGPSEGAKTSQNVKDAPTADTSTLKKVEIVDLVKGKPTAYQPHLKPVAVGDMVWVVYTGKLKDGTEFDSNNPKEYPDKWPYAFTVGAGEVIPGWEEGLLGILPGGKRKLSIPAEKGYGAAGSGKIPPNADLYFEIEVLDVLKAGEGQIIDIDKSREKVGTGLAAGPGRKIKCQEVLTTINGKVMEDSHQHQPIEFTMGNNEAQIGFESAITGMKPGGVRYFRLPPDVGIRFTNLTDQQVPPMISYFKVEMISVK